MVSYYAVSAKVVHDKSNIHEDAKDASYENSWFVVH